MQHTGNTPQPPVQSAAALRCGRQQIAHKLRERCSACHTKGHDRAFHRVRIKLCRHARKNEVMATSS